MPNLRTYFLLGIILLVSMGKVCGQSTGESIEITSQAFGVYSEPGGRDSLEANSNILKIFLRIRPEFNLYPNNVVSEYSGNGVELTHMLTNSGNRPSTLDIKVHNLNNDDFNLENLQWKTQNQKSRASSSGGYANTSRSDTLKTSVTLNPGETFEFSYTGDINSSIEGQIQALLNVEARSREFGISYQNVDTVNVLVGTRLTIDKKQLNANNLQPGDSFTYELTGANVGDVNAPGREITIDGVQKNKVILTDPIPANLTFAGFGDFDKGTPLYHLPGNDKYVFSATPPKDISTVDMIGVAYDSLLVDETVVASFDVKVNENAGGEIKNVAEFAYVDPEGAVTTTTASNQVISQLPEGDAELNFFNGEDYEEKTGTSSVGKPLYLESSAAQCNESAGTMEEVSLRLESDKTGDKEIIPAVETGYNTGVFRIKNPIPTRNANDYPVVQGNEILETVEKDKLIATLECDGINNGGGVSESVTANVVVDPSGIVFDSESNRPVKDAKVSIINTNTGNLATVYDMDQQTPLENPQTTGDDGTFRFPFLPTGSYKLQVEPPEGYTFVSEVPTNLLPEGRDIDKDGSYGQTFTFDQDPGSGVEFDIPLDPKREGVLFVEKKADREEAEIGEFVNYILTIRSEAVNTVDNLTITDQLPFGFEYQPGSARLEGQPIDDPEGGKGPTLKFDIGDIESGSKKELRYKLLVGPGAERGDGTNTAVAQSDEIITRVSNQAKVQIEVKGGVFSTEGFIIGKVFADCNRNGVQDLGELGIPGVRLYLENGNYVITDSQGLYTFYGIQPNMHVLKLDNYTLPKGSQLVNLDSRHAGDPSSRFVDLQRGQMHRAEFAVCNCTSGMTQEIKTRRRAYSQADSTHLSNVVKKDFRVEDRNTSRSFDEASGTVGNTQTPEISTEDSLAEDKQPLKNNIHPDTTNGVDLQNIEKALINAEPGLTFLRTSDGDTLDSDQVTLWAKGRAGAKFKLTVNDQQIDDNKIGRQSVMQAKELQVWEYVSIPLQPGRNTIRLQEVDPFGNTRGSKEIQVTSPDELANVNVTVPRNDVNADGKSTALVRVELVDNNGLPIGSRMPITLDTSMGIWKVKDNNQKKPGTQTFIEGGTRNFELLSTSKPTTATAKAHVGSMVGKAEVNFLPDLRPLMAAGIVQGTMRLSDPLNIQSATSADGFERELTALSYSMNNFTADGRIAFFLKGKVRGDMLLTASYDSEKNKEDRLFRDIRPDEFYPVYGESSVKGFDAQSTSRLYVRVDKKKTYALYGDFITQERNRDRELGNYSRAQTGVKAHYEQGAITANVFGSSSISRQRVRRIQGRGISRYELPDKNIVENSEIIEIITVDRNQPDLVLNIERLTRFRDYFLEPFSGILTFRSPVSSVDENFNPIYIRATYEVENNDKRYLVGGANTSIDLTDNINVGGGIVQDNNPDNEFTMASGNVSIKLGKNTEAIGEVAHTRRDLEGSGTAERLKLQHRGENANLIAQVAKSSEDFSNPTATLGQGRTEAKARGQIDITSSTNLNGEFLLSRNDTTGAQTIGGMLNVQKSFTQNINAELGLRHSEQTGDQETTNTNARGKITADLPFLDGASVTGEYEQDINNPDRKLIGVGGDYRLDWGKFYASHEFISSAKGAYTLSSSQERQNTAVGFDLDYMKNGKVYSEYRIDNALSGRSGQAAIGLRNRFMIREGFGINAGFERTFTVRGAPSNDGTSITSSVDYTANPNWKGTARAEARLTSDTDTYFGSLGYGQKISRDWTFLGKNVVSLNTQDGISGLSRVQQRLRLGTAYRDIRTDRFDALFRYEFNYEDDVSVGPDYYRYSHVFSTHTNYKPHRDWIISGRLAAKKSAERQDELRAESFLEMASTRLMYDINQRLDASVHGSLLMDADFAKKDYGLGVEMGYVVAKNLRLAAGFNLFGYNDKDLATNNYTQKGIYAGFSYKFDEQLFRNLIPKGKDNILDESRYQTCQPCQQKPITVLRPDLSESVDLPGLTMIPVKAKDFVYTQLEARPVLPEHVHFANNSTYINQPAAHMLDLVAKYLLKNGGESYSINVTGHTDSKSSYSYNLELSRRRARAVRTYLVAAGVDPKKLQFKGLSYSDDARQEADRVDMALNRRVELDLNIEDKDVRFIPQVEDLQVIADVPGIPEWDYVFISRINAVPQQLNITADTLNAVHRYIIERIKLTMTEHNNLKIELQTGATELAQRVKKQLVADGISRGRIAINITESMDTVRFNYSNPERLVIYDQRDDVRLAQNEVALNMMQNLLSLLKSREDYLLIREHAINEQIPRSMNIEDNGGNLAYEKQAILSRIGSYLKKASDTALRITGNTTNRTNIRKVQEYLIEWGISKQRIDTVIVEDLPDQQVNFEYDNNLNSNN